MCSIIRGWWIYLTIQTNILRLFDEYQIALLEWNDAIKNKNSDKGRVRLTSIRYDRKEFVKEQLEDEILKNSGVDRYWKRKNEGLF